VDGRSPTGRPCCLAPKPQRRVFNASVMSPTPAWMVPSLVRTVARRPLACAPNDRHQPRPKASAGCRDSADQRQLLRAQEASRRDGHASDAGPESASASHGCGLAKVAGRMEQSDAAQYRRAGRLVNALTYRSLRVPKAPCAAGRSNPPAAISPPSPSRRTQWRSRVSGGRPRRGSHATRQRRFGETAPRPRHWSCRCQSPDAAALQRGVTTRFR
jgi:hypothetical protein